VGAGRDVNVGGEGIFLLAGTTRRENMSVLSVCSVTLESRCLRRRFEIQGSKAVGAAEKGHCD
jgi:hypothetical protein